MAFANCDPTVRDAVLVAVTRAHENLSGDGLARLLSIPRRSLTKRLTQAGFPAPPRLLTWGRLIVAAQMLDDLNRSADAVSAALKFPSGSAFRNTCQRYVHATPTELRQRGGAEYVVSLLLAETDRSATPNSRVATRASRRACASRRNSSRVFASSRNDPSSALVIVFEFCFSTPRIIMQRCMASITTPTPRGAKHFVHCLRDLTRQAAPAPEVDARTLRRCRGSLERPSMRPDGMYAM